MQIFQSILYLIAIAASLACTLLLFRGYLRTRVRILLWAALCFVCLTANNLLLFVDLVVLPTIDMRLYRYVTALTGTLFMIYGFLSDTE